MRDSWKVVALTGPYRQSADDLLTHLDEQVSFLKRSSEAFDNGYEDEAKRLAIVIRVLVHDTDSSLSLLGQLNRKNFPFYDTALPRTPGNLLSYSGLTIMRMSPGGLTYLPRFQWHLLEPNKSEPLRRMLDFRKWWDQVIIEDANTNTFSRRELVLTMANKEGGAHIDPALKKEWAEWTRKDSMGWIYHTGDASISPGGPHLASVREIALEVMQSLQRKFPDRF